MKKNYYFLSVVLLLAFGFEGSSQQSYAEGFEPFEFTIGNINGQNGWQALTAQGLPFGGCSISDDDIQMFSNPNYLKINHDPNFPASENLDFFCLSPSLNTVPFELVQGNASISVYIQPDNDNQTPGANYAVQFDDGEHVTASVLYLNDGSIAVADKINGILQYISTTAAWNAGEDKQLNISINLQAGTLKYNIQGEDIYTGNVLNGIALDRFAVRYDNQPGSVAYFDSMFVFGHNEVLETEQPLAQKITLYPNPAKNLINISGLKDSISGPITIYSSDGKLMSVNVTGEAGLESIDISGLAMGIYYIAIPTDKGIDSQKFIKQ